MQNLVKRYNDYLQGVKPHPSLGQIDSYIYVGLIWMYSFKLTHYVLNFIDPYSTSYDLLLGEYFIWHTFASRRNIS